MSLLPDFSRALVGTEAIGSAKRNCRENCLRKTAQDWKADKPGFLECSRGRAARLHPGLRCPCQAPPRAGPGGSGLQEGASLCDRLSVHVHGGAAKRSRSLWQLSSGNFSREPPAAGEGRSEVLYSLAGEDREGSWVVVFSLAVLFHVVSAQWQ